MMVIVTSIYWAFTTFVEPLLHARHSSKQLHSQLPKYQFYRWETEAENLNNLLKGHNVRHYHKDLTTAEPASMDAHVHDRVEDWGEEITSYLPSRSMGP